MIRFEYLPNVVSLALDQEKCLGCGLCLEVCPQGVLAMDQGLVVLARRDACMECGACMLNCPSGALTVQAGVGCAQAVINSALGRQSSSCCCVVEQRPQPAPMELGSLQPKGKSSSGCC